MTRLLRWLSPLLLLISALSIPLSVSAQQTIGAGITYDRVTDDHPVLTYTIHVGAGTALDMTMERASGDLLPYLVLSDANDTIMRRSPTRDRATYIHYEFTKAGDYHLKATRFDAEDGVTTGDFILQIGGTTLTSGDVPPHFRYPAIFASRIDELLTGRAVTNQFTGQADDENPVNYYLVYLTSRQTLHATMTQVTGDLYPALVLTDLTLKPVGQRGKPSDDKKLSTLDTQVKESGWYVLTAARFDFDNGETSGLYQLIVSIQ